VSPQHFDPDQPLRNTPRKSSLIIHLRAWCYMRPLCTSI